MDVFDEVHVANLCGNLEFQARGVAPQVFERVVGSLLFRENVDHNIAIMRDNPLTLREPVDDQRFHVMIFPKAFLELICDCLEMRLAGAGAYEEEIRERGDAA